MKNQFKRLLSLMLVVIMLVPMISATGLTVSAATYSGKCGANLTWNLDTATGVLKIDGTGDMYDYSSEYYNGSYRTTAPWKTYISYIKSVVISDSVTSISWYAFYKCTSLTSVTIGNSVTSIGDCAFYSCTSLTSVTIGNSVTSIGDVAFADCDSLTSVTIPDSVTSIGLNAFYNTAYYNNSSNWTNDVLYIGNHLISAKNSISGACSIKDGTLTIADYAFAYCTSLTSVTIGNSVISIGEYAFCDCDSLTSVTIPDSVTSIGSSAFSSCTSLTSVTIPDSVTSIGKYAFAYCTSLTSVTIPDSVTSIGSYAFHFCTSLTSVTIPDSVTSIGEYAFYSCSSLTSVTIPDSVSSIGGGAFSSCTSLTSVTIGNSVTSIGEGAFSHCTSLTSVTIPDSVTSIGYRAFYGCDSLTSVTIGNSVTSIDDSAFRDCDSLTSVTIGNSVTSIGEGAFYYCFSLTSVTIPDSVTSIGSYAFYACTSLTSVTIPDSVTSIGEWAFHYYNNGYKPLNLTIKCYENSYAHTYAKNNGFKHELMVCEHIFINYISDNNATCTEDGTKTAYCDNGCGAVDTIVDENTAMGHSFTVYTDTAATCTDDAYRTAYCDNGCGTVDTIINEGTALGHTWSDWMTVTEPTYTTEGLRMRYCMVCLFGEEEAIPKLEIPVEENIPVITVDNFTVTITNAENIKDMRYALGVYSTTTEIRNAEGNVALSEALIVKNTVDGNFVYTMPNGGMYSIWIRMKDGTNYILPLDVTKIDASVTTYGVKVTVHDIFEVKDIYIAKGEYQTYREIKDNGYIVALSANKIGNKHDYTYTVYEPGVHTVLIRYNDGRTALFHETLTVDEPVFTTNGLQITVSNIPDVKVIRTAYGEYNTPGDTKRAAGARNFSSKVIKGADQYTLQYRENGIVTVVVEYNNGYIEIFHHEIKQKTATMVQTKSVVMFKDLDNFVMIRYAPGEYSTSAEIKRASGSKVIKPADITNGMAVITGLKAGTYTFCVQFDDESYNYFKVTVE